MDRVLLSLTVGLSVAALAVGVAFGYTATVQGANLSGGGTCISVEICWEPGEVPPSTSNMTASGYEHDTFQTVNLGGGGSTTGTPYGSAGTPHPKDPNDPFGTQCATYLFCFPEHECDILGDEEYSVVLTIAQPVPNGPQTVGTPVKSINTPGCI